VVVAGLGLRLVPAAVGSGSGIGAGAGIGCGAGAGAGIDGRLLATARRAQPAGAALAVLAIVLEPGTAAGVLALGWVGVCLVATGAGVGLGWRSTRTAPTGRLPGAGDLAVAVALAYLSVGAAWLACSRFGWHPLGFSTDIVRLTGVHFHYAGFALPLLGALALRVGEGRSRAARALLVLGCAASVVGPPIVALGFTYEAAIPQAGGAVVMTVAAWAVAAGTVWSVGPAWRRRGWPAAGGALLAVSAASPIVAMVLAVQWAIGQHWAVPALSVDDMAATHGLLNGLGFVGAGLAGWTILGRLERR
jgi:hypothetical protein